MRARINLVPSGGGSKTEIRADNKGGWLILDFIYDENGKRTKTKERRDCTDEMVLDEIREDEQFWNMFQRLATHPRILK